MEFHMAGKHAPGVCKDTNKEQLFKSRGEHDALPLTPGEYYTLAGDHYEQANGVQYAAGTKVKLVKTISGGRPNENYHVIEFPDGITIAVRDGAIMSTNIKPTEFSADEVTINFALDAANVETVDGKNYVRRKAPLVFKCGEYKDKNFSMNVQEGQNAVSNFKPVNFGVQHLRKVGIPTILDGKLGKLDKLTLNPQTGEFSGEALIPEWLDQLMIADGGQYPISAGWNPKTKLLDHCDFVTNPRIDGAALTAAFSASPFFDQNMSTPVQAPTPRQGVSEGMDAVQHGAKLWNKIGGYVKASLEDSRRHPNTYKDSYIRDLEKVLKMCERNSTGGQYEPTTDDAGVGRGEGAIVQDAVSPTANYATTDPPPPQAQPVLMIVDGDKTYRVAVPGPAPNFSSAEAAKPPESEEEMLQVKRLKKKLKKERKARVQEQLDGIKRDAVTFSKSKDVTDRFTPAEEAGLVDLYVQAATDDLRDPVTFANGDTRLSLFKKNCMLRQPHGLNRELAPQAQAAAVLDSSTFSKTDTLTPQRRAELLGASPLGRDILTKESKNGTTAIK
jgi:hypothetical protein